MHSLRSLVSHWWWDKAKSVNKFLFIAASVSKSRLIIVTWYFMFTFRLIYVCRSALKWPGGGALFESDSNKRWGPKMGPLFESPPRSLLKPGMRPLDRYVTRQETISRRLKQMYTPSDTGLEWLGEGPLYKSVSNKRQGSKLRLLFKSFPGNY